MPPDRVECHSGHTYAERPTALYWEGVRLNIAQIQARWRLPGERRFRVRTEDDRVFELLYAEPQDEWVIQPL